MWASALPQRIPFVNFLRSVSLKHSLAREAQTNNANLKSNSSSSNSLEIEAALALDGNSHENQCYYYCSALFFSVTPLNTAYLGVPGAPMTKRGCGGNLLGCQHLCHGS